MMLRTKTAMSIADKAASRIEKMLSDHGRLPRGCTAEIILEEMAVLDSRNCYVCGNPVWSDKRNCNYYIDDFGRLWKGPIHNESNLHYAVFEGFQSDGTECWVYRQSNASLEWEMITEQVAKSIIQWYKNA